MNKVIRFGPNHGEVLQAFEKLKAAFKNVNVSEYLV